MKMMTRCILLFILLSPIVKGYANDRIFISGNIDFLKENELVIIRLYEYGYLFRFTSARIDTIWSKEKRFKIELLAPGRTFYADIFFPEHPNNSYYRYLVKGGDSILIGYHDGQNIFGGNCVSAMELQYRLKDLRLHSNVINPLTLQNNDGNRLMAYLDQVSSLKEKQLALIRNWVPQPNGYEDSILMTDIILDNTCSLFNGVFYFNLLNKDYFTSHSGFRDSVAARIGKDEGTDLYLSHSELFPLYVELRYRIDSGLLANKIISPLNFYRYVTQLKVTRFAREKCLAYYIYQYRLSSSDEMKKVAQLGYHWIHNSDLRYIVARIKDTLMEGAKGFDFSLADSSGTIHRLSDYKGKVVVMDFWYTGCGNCRAIQPNLRKVERDFLGKPVVFLSINVDKDRSKWVKSVRTGNYTSEYTVNLYTGGAGVNGEVVKHYGITGYPTVLLLNSKGLLVTTPEDVRTDNGKDLLNKIWKLIRKVND